MRLPTALFAGLLFASTAQSAVLTASTPAGLTAALKQAQPGDSILLAAGTYGGLSIDGVNYAAPGVVISSADPAHPAVLTNFNMGINSPSISGLTFRGLQFQALTPCYSAFSIYSASRITFDQIKAYGPAGPPNDSCEAFRFFDSNTIAFTNSEISQVAHGLSIARTDHVTVAGNRIHHVNSDTLDFTQVSDARVSGNVLHDFYPTSGNHPDAIQFGTANSTAASHDVTISDNLIWRGAGQNTQGIFLGDEVGTLPFQNFTISGNLVVGTGSSGIRPTHDAGLTITSNELVTLAGGDPTPLLVQFSDRVVLTANSAAAISAKAADGNTNVTLSGNVITTSVSDGGLASINRFAQAHPAMAPMIAAMLGTTPVPTPPVLEITLLPGQTVTVHAPPT